MNKSSSIPSNKQIIQNYKFSQRYNTAFLQDPTSPERAQRTVAIVSIILGTLVLLGIVLVSYFVPQRVIPFICKKEILGEKILPIKILLHSAVAIWNIGSGIILFIFLIGGIHACSESRRRAEHRRKSAAEKEYKDFLEVFQEPPSGDKVFLEEEDFSDEEEISEEDSNDAPSEISFDPFPNKITGVNDEMEPPSSITSRLLQRDRNRRKGSP